MRVEALAASLGVSKRGFYWHFKDRQALMEETLDAWEKVVVDAAIARVETEQPSDEPRGKLQALFELAMSTDVFAADLLAVELALRDWSRRDAAIVERVRRIDNRRMVYMRSLFRQFSADDDDAEARSMLAFALFVGNYFIAAEHDGRKRAEVLQFAVHRLLSDSWEP